MLLPHKEEYSQYCSSGSIKKEKTNGRIEVMTKYFTKYFQEFKESETAKNEPVSNYVENIQISSEVTDSEETISIVESSSASDNEKTITTEEFDDEVSTGYYPFAEKLANLAM